MNNDMNEKKPNSSKAGATMGLIFGAGIGMLFGLVLGGSTIGIAMGLTFGAGIGLIFGGSMASNSGDNV